MPFVLASCVGRGMGVLDEGGDRRRGRGSFGVNLGRPIVTSGDFVCLFVCVSVHVSVGRSVCPESVLWQNS